MFNKLEFILNIWEDELKKRSASEIVIGSIGLIIGLLIAFLISQPVYKIPIPYLGSAISLILYGMFGYLGVNISLKNKDDVIYKIRDLGRERFTKDKISKVKSNKSLVKVLDTNVLIDGRILDISRTRFLEGTLIVPIFVLEELQHIADSSDGLKRNRGRRGLDIVKEMQDNPDINVEISNEKYDDIKEVDSKLLALAKDLDASVVTNDYNLNKVAAVQGVFVLNINELANAVKPLYLPGERMQVTIVKLGKEHNQGLGYLDDGTMIVVEQGREYLGSTIDVEVTSILQTSAGKMIFARPL